MLMNDTPDICIFPDVASVWENVSTFIEKQMSLQKVSYKLR